MIRNIVFDIGNVLSDYRWRDFLRDKGFDEAMVERIARASVLNPAWNEIDRGVWSEEEILREFIRSDPEIEEEIRRAFSNIRGLVTPRDYAVPWIRELKEKGFSVYYLSNFSHKAQVECAEALTFLPYTDGGILSWQEKLIKPDRAIYELLLSRYGLKAEECVFLDDTRENVEGAKACGFYGICFETKEQAEEELRRLL
ncbi:MAG: HAD family phosphatase [Roseburia sp.]|nr:HAD family phosphatase [Roseburia sp.]MCM1097270.1 HAD family phosphatase [Ruminococcus flavefaciens]